MRFPFRSLLPVAALAIAGTGIVVPTAVADEDPPPPVLHQVQYTVFSETPFRNASIYYRDVDPPTFAEYSHNPYVFSPKVEADVGPSQMWTLNVMLADPNQWAMVVASSPDTPQIPNLHCVLAVDGQVVATDQGPKGALCSIRNW